MQIQKLSDHDLLSTLQDAVASEREKLVLQLQIFIEMDRRKLYGGRSSL